MPEFLVITTRQNIIDVAHHLTSEDGLEIKLEDDFAKGLKAIFYRLPEVVFIQEEIAGITAEKVAGQVRTLLDDEPIRIMLLREQEGEWDPGSTVFNGAIDARLPFDELVHRFREELNRSHAPDAVSDGGAAELDSQGEPATQFDLLESGQEIDPFLDMFPAQFHNDWSGFSPDLEREPHEQEEAPKPAELPSMFGDDFCFETPGEIVSSLPAENRPRPLKKTFPSASSGSAAKFSEMHGEEKRIRMTDRESPHQLFSSINGGDGGQSDVVSTANDDPGAPISDRLRLRGVSTQSSLLKTDYPAESSPRVVSTSETASAPASAPAASTRGRSLRESPIPESTSGTTKREKTLPRGLGPLLLVVSIALATYLLLNNWDSMFRITAGDEEHLNIPQPEVPPAIRTLPAFFPSVRPDTSYSAQHPGWERYPGAGIDYLAYRESGVLKALQIIAGPEGKISDSLVRLCIRETAGLENVGSWTSRQNNGFLVETAAMGNRGEVAVYRKMPEGDIRGVVLTFR